VLSSSGREWVDHHIDRASGIERLRARFVHHAYGRHAHETYAIGMTETGSQSFTCRGTRHATRPGALMLFHPAELHDGSATDAGGFTYRMLYIAAPIVRGLLAEEDAAADLTFRRPLEIDPGSAALVIRAYDALDADEFLLARDEALLHLLRLLHRRYGDGRPVPRLSTRADRAVERVRERLHAGIEDDIPLQALAEIAGLSRFHLTRLFQRRFGWAPSAYHRHLRLERAKHLLAADEAPATVAAALGFADQAHLTRQFKAAYGIAPGRFRKSCLEAAGRRRSC